MPRLHQLRHRRESVVFPSIVRAFASLALLVITACSGGSELSTEEVRLLAQEGRIGEAIVHLEAMLEESPDDRELNHLYGAALLTIGDASQAIWPLLKASESPDATAEDYLMLARAHLVGGSASDAIAVIDGLLEETPDILEAYQLRIEANQGLNRLARALEDVEYVLQHRPDDADMLLSRAALLLDLERPDEAEAAIADAQSVMDQPGNPEAWAARFCAVGVSLVFERGGGGHAERATEAWEACIEAHPADALVVTEAVGFFEGQGNSLRSEEILRSALERAPEDVDFLVALGQRLAARGEDEEAVSLLRRASDSHGGAQARPMLIDYYSERQEYDEALAVLVDWMNAMPDPPVDLRILRADLLVRAGDFEAAEVAIAELEKPEFRSLLEGRLALERGDPERALTLLEQGIAMWPSNAVARILAAEAAGQLGDFDRSLAEYIEAIRADPANWEALAKVAAMQRALRRPEPTGQLVNRYIGEKPRDPEGYRLKFEIGLWSGREDMARAAIRDVGQIPGQRATAVALGGRLRARRSPAEAATFVANSQLDLTHPVNAEALTVLVENLLAISRHEVALNRTDVAVAAHPDVAAFHELRGRSLLAAEAPAEASRAALERAVELDPDRVSARLALGRLLEGEGELEAALSHFDRASESDVADSEAEWAAIEALLATGREDGVDARLEKLLGDHGEHAEACELAARRIVAEEGDLTRARSLAERSVRLYGRAPALTTLGGIYRRQGEFEPAIRALRQSLELRPDSPSTRYELGVALVRSGDAEGARAEFEKALESEGFAEEPRARAELARLERERG